MRKYLFAVMAVSFLAFAPPARGKTFKNAYISFEMQDNWNCIFEQTEWVCRAEDPVEAKEAVIVLTAKQTGPPDSFKIYENHMNEPISTVNRSGVTMVSTVKYKVQNKKINDQPWLDGLHSDSEVKNYFTRYLATIKDQISILVTFSAHNKFYSKHSANFNKAIQTLTVVASKDFGKAPDAPPRSDIYGKPEGAGPVTDSGGDSDLENGIVGSSKSFFKSKMALVLLFLIGALVLFVFMKIRSKR